MKNIKVSMKLIVSFLIVIVMTVIIGGIGIFGMLQINGTATSMYENQTVPMPYMTKIMEMLQRQRACMREYIIGSALNDMDLIEDAHSRVQQYQPVLEQNMDLYKATILTKDSLDVFNAAHDLYESKFLECMDKIYTMAKGDTPPEELYPAMQQYTDDVNKIVDDFESCLDKKVAVASDANNNGDTLFSTLMIVIIVALVFVVVFAMVWAVYVSGMITKPLLPLTEFMLRAGSTGDITLSQHDLDVINKYSTQKDELGRIIYGATQFVQLVTTASEELGKIALGDLTEEVKVLSEKDALGNSLKKMVESLNEMFNEINGSTTQVSTGAKQIADGAQSLAQGSTEQAASVEELSSSISEIASKTRTNAEMASKAAMLATTIMNNAEKGSTQMDEMMAAVKDINTASQQISKVIKVIDDIAFQTNILALNAAVEAARAGQHGKGFAVVAEEVRNLASKSAEAAKDTGNLIANSMEKAELGSRIAGETSASLAEIVSGINESNRIVSEIAQSSDEQSQGIEQINKGIDQVAQVVQQNSATAEESAAASEELSSQSAVLEGLIAQFQLKDAVPGYRSLKAAPKRAPQKQLAMASKSSSSSNDWGFGKY